LIKNNLQTKEVSDAVKSKGIVYLVKEWYIFVEYCKNGFEDNFDEYTNDLSIRHIIQDILDTLDDKNLRTKIQAAISNGDQEFKNLLVETDKKIWPTPSDDKEKYFWYWGIVRNAKGELLEDLKSDKGINYYKK